MNVVISTIEGRKVNKADLVYEREMKQAPKPKFLISFLPMRTRCLGLTPCELNAAITRETVKKNATDKAGAC